MAHMVCYQGILLKRHDLPPLSSGNIACTKRCYEKVLKTQSSKNQDDDDTRKGNWDSDGKNGPDDPHTSIKILLDWWMEVPNYSKYRGKNNDGVKKKQYCDALAQKMTNETTSQRDGRNVKSKIEHIERSFKKAHIYATSETGAGVKENDTARFDEVVKRKCPHYYDILEIMQDRASSKPKATNYDFDSDDDELELEECTRNLTETSGYSHNNSEEEDDDQPSVHQGSVDDSIPASISASAAGGKRGASAASVASATSKSSKKQRAPRKSHQQLCLMMTLAQQWIMPSEQRATGFLE